MTVVPLRFQLRDRSFFRTPRTGRGRHPEVGEYAGRGRYMPRDISTLTPQLSRAIGKIAHLELAAVAREDQAARDQRLYRECRGTAMLAGAWISEQDLDFLD